MVASGTNWDKPFETTSMSAILFLEKGDEVYARLSSGTLYGRPENHYTTFSGFLIGSAVSQNQDSEKPRTNVDQQLAGEYEDYESYDSFQSSRTDASSWNYRKK